MLVRIVCVDDRKSKLFKLNEEYIATEEDNVYIINSELNNMDKERVSKMYGKKNIKARKKMFEKIGVVKQ